MERPTPENPRDHAHHPHRVPAKQATDSAEIPWAGRDLSPSGFEADLGMADPMLRRLLADEVVGDVDDDRSLFTAVAQARFLVPVVAEPTEMTQVDGLLRDTGVDMAVVILTGRDGQRALPVFTGLDALAAWDPAARPIPVTAARAAQAAVTDLCEVLVVDVAGPCTRVVRSSMLWALAQHQQWLPAHEDPQVDAAFAAAVDADPALTAYALSGGPHGELRARLTLVPGLTREQVTAVLIALGERIAADGEVRARIDALSFTVS